MENFLNSESQHKPLRFNFYTFLDLSTLSNLCLTNKKLHLEITKFVFNDKADEEFDFSKEPTLYIK